MLFASVARTLLFLALFGASQHCVRATTGPILLPPLRSRVVSAATQDECLALKARVERALAETFRKKDAYVVQRGWFGFAFVGEEAVLDCESNNCAFTNPKSPYGAAVLPLALNEDYLQKYDDPRTPAYAIESFDQAGGDGQSRLWQLRADEAVVAIGCTPPPPSARYFAITGYISEIYDHDFSQWVSVFGSVEDTIGIYRQNDEDRGVENRMRTSALVESDDPELASAFNKLTVVLMGASKRSVQNLKSQIRRALLPFGLEDALNVIPISKPYAEHIGLEPYDSYYALIVRSILPMDGQEAFKEYAQGDPLSAWRITPRRKTLVGEDDRFELPTFVPRQLIHLDEDHGFEDPFVAGLEFLMHQIERSYDSEYAVAHAIGSGSSLGLLDIDSGLDCLRRKINFCNGDNRDAQYLATYPMLLLDDEEKFAYVVGVNHRETGLVVYSNVAVSDVQAKLGVRSIDDEEMRGSADVWLKGTPFEDMSHYFYALRFARHCDDDDAYCTVIPSDGRLAVPYDREILISSRLYVNAQTGVGPDAKDVAMPHMMAFTPRGRHTRRDVRERIDVEALNVSPCVSAFLSLTLCSSGINADCCNGVVSWTEGGCFCDSVGKLLIDTLPPSTGERGLRALSMICGRPALATCPAQ